MKNLFKALNYIEIYKQDEYNKNANTKPQSENY